MRDNPNHNMYQRNGRWYFQYKKVRKPLNTDKVLIARERRDALLKELNYHGDEWLVRKVPFGQVVLDYLKLKEAEQIQPESVANYKTIFRIYVSKAGWAKKAVSDIKPIDIEEWIKIDIDAKNRFKNRILTVLSGAFKYAVKKGYIQQNPVSLVDRPKNEPYEPQAYTDEEVAKIIEAAGEHKNFLIVKFFTGMRISEICGLKWNYIDFPNRIIKVRESRFKGRQRKGAKNNYSIRNIKMLPVVYDALISARKSSLGKSEWVFLNANGKPLNHRNVGWKKVVEKAGVRYLPFKDTRHTYISMALREGERPLATAKSVGHRDTRMINKHYEAYVPDEEDGSRIAQKSTTILLHTATGSA